MSAAMQEPACILKNGQSVPYIPLEVKTARDAYAASLHVIFKHVADFHICIVKTISAKYGIPEDDILKTIQESEEFKNMKVDPVLDTGMQSLGYLDEVPVTEVPTTTTDVPKTTPNAKKTKTPVVADTQVPVSKLNAKNIDSVEPVVVESHVNLEETPAKITKIIRKKSVPKPVTDAQASSVPTAPASSVPTATTTASSVPTAPASSVPTATTTASSVPTAPASSVPTATTTASSVPLASEGDVPRKIIKKKTNTTKPN